MFAFMKRIVLVCMLLAFSSTAFAEDEVNPIDMFNSGKPVIKSGVKYDIPFRQVGGLIIVKVRLNNAPKDYDFIFDTGSSGILLSKSVAKELKLKSDGKTFFSDPWQTEDAAVVTLQSVRLNDVEVQNIRADVFELKPFEERGLKVDGIIGNSFFKFFVCKIDYGNGVLSIAAKSECFPEINSGYRVELDKYTRVLWTTIKLEGLEQPQDIIINTGAADNYLTFSMDVFAELKPFLHSKIVKPSGITAYGLVSGGESLQTRIGGIRLGDFQISNLPATFFSGNVNLIGANFLSQFTVIINYPESYVKLIPNDNAWQETNIITYGFVKRKQADGKDTVVAIWEDSPAGKSGLEAGDEILSICSASGVEVTEEEFANKKYDTIEVTVKRNGEIKKISITKGKLLPDN